MQKAFKSRSSTDSTKHPNNIFPNKISIELPQVLSSQSTYVTHCAWDSIFSKRSVCFWQNEAQLSDLKKELKHDTEIMKAKANVLNIDKVSCNQRISLNILIGTTFYLSESWPSHLSGSNIEFRDTSYFIRVVHSTEYFIQVIHSFLKMTFPCKRCSIKSLWNTSFWYILSSYLHLFIPFLVGSGALWANIF